MSTAAPGIAATSATLLRTPLHQYHVDHGGKMVEFAGWEMPILYRSIIEEHNQVRTSGGLFDVSHMGRLRFTGRDACRFFDHACTRQIVDMQPGQCRYSLVCNEGGGCRDDVLVYRLGESEFIMVCNASNRLKLLGHFEQIKGATGMVFKLADETMQTAMIALQGPKVIDLISRFSKEIPALKRYRFVEKNLIFASVLISRTGYTGEDGVEVILPARFVGQALKLMLGSLGDDAALIRPAGLGARDSLRLEAGMPLYGHELTEEIDPLAAGLNFAVKLDKGEGNPDAGRFIGQDALQRIAREGVRRPLVGLTLDGKRSARQGMTILRDGAEVGLITSGCVSPTLGRPIAMGYLDAVHAQPGTRVQIDLGKSHVDAEIVKLPFHKSC
jgi:aminomethyltransferase